MDIRNDLLHSSDSMHSLSCINTHNTDELSKEKEEELLYGTGDDGDEEDALSDDSMRLRLSDDEIETEDILTSVLNNQENTSKINEIAMTSTKTDDMEILSIQENSIIKKNVDLKKEEQCLDNDSMDDKILIDYEKIVKKGENEETRKSETVNTSAPWQSYQSQYRYSRSSNSHSVRGINQRFRHMTPRGRRSHSYDYNLRFYNGFPLFERGRNNGMFHSYRSIHGSRYQKKGFRSNTTQKQNRSTECDQNSTSLSKKSISSKSQDSDIEIININDNKTIDEANTLGNESLINSKNDHSNEPLNEEVDNISAKNKSVVNTHSANSSLELKHSLEENSEIISSNVHTLSDNFSENSANNSYDDNNSNQENEISKNDINNTNSFSDFCISENSKNVEALNINKKYELDKDQTIKHTEGKSNQEQNKNINNEEDKTVKTIDTNENKEIKEIYKLKEQEHNRNEELTNLSQKIDLSENNCITVLNFLKEKETLNNDMVLNEKDTDHKREDIFKNKKKEILFENIKLKENHENSNSKSATVLNDVINDKNVNVSEKPLIDSENCDNQLKGSDNSTNSIKINKSDASEIHPKIDLWKQKDITEKDMNSTKKENSIVTSTTKTNENTELTLNKNNSSSIKLKNDLLNFVTDTKNNDDDKRSVNIPVTTQKRRRRSKKEILAAQEVICEEERQVRESGRQKRQTAKNAEEIIRKKFLTYDSEVESSDDSEKFVAVNYKMNQDARPLSPPSLKRIYSDNTDNTIINGGVKKIKTNFEERCDETKTQENNFENIKKLKYIHKFFQRDLNEKLPKLKQEELEELLIQKIVETITMRDEIGKLREQARISEKNQEVTRAKCQQLAKQIKDFEMVLSRNAADRRANNDKSIPPIKINRSVGLQVNFITDHGMQNLRQLQQNSMKSLNVSSSNNTLSTSINETNNVSSPRKGIKIRSPRRTEPIIGQTPAVSQNSTQSPNIMTTITPAALVVAKPVDTQHPLTLSNQSNVQQIMSNPQVQPQQSQQAIVLNGKFPNQINRQGTTTTNITKSHANDLIDLTDEEEKNRTTGIPVVTTTVTDQQVNLTQKTQQPCFQRVIQTIPGNVITSQPPSIRVVQPASQPTPTALVNNMNAPRLAYVMQSGVGPTRQLLIAPNSNPMRPVTSCRASFPTLTYKTGVSTIANGTVRVLTTPATANVHNNKHPAPLPDIRNYAANSLWKLPPPAPSLKISRVSHGIVLSWNMNLSDKHADIVSYQLYAYQEIADVLPSTSLWKKVGDVRALPLPMACTLTQFSEGNNYYFAVRAVDTHSRKGQYSIPGNISL
ncbi:Activating transcription factor 7-interacting protein 1 [Melipona quadrifasciata]|uniref:Activating transcription factor 7-interacting protein 1 n=1 Tax=Melipona quadrifasciata TaxID=166423 RepID=A0A0N0BIP0_9HYME|nr:Activating transcription factor 7-interacting protein 1 [Melipona quadrifasciata]